MESFLQLMVIVLVISEVIGLLAFIVFAVRQLHPARKRARAHDALIALAYGTFHGKDRRALEAIAVQG